MAFLILLPFRILRLTFVVFVVVALCFVGAVFFPTWELYWIGKRYDRRRRIASASKAMDTTARAMRVDAALRSGAKQQLPAVHPCGVVQLSSGRRVMAHHRTTCPCKTLKPPAPIAA